MPGRLGGTRPHFIASMLALALSGATAGEAYAQSAEVAFLDGDGAWQWVEISELSSFARKSDASSEERAGPFNIIYEDVEQATGVGFDDPELGEARRQTLWAVLHYIGQVLDVPGQADILIRESQTDGRGALASAGPFLIPESGFQGGLVFEHLTTGVDPIPDAADGAVTVDFGFPWSSETDPVAEDEQDLFSTLLHEVTHALGLLSVVAPDGRSAVFNSGDRGLFSVFDSLLIRESTEMSVFLEGGEVNSTADDFVATGDLVFAGERAQRSLGFYPRIFAPPRFFEGSSIGHWSSENGSSVMLPAIGRGMERREYEPWEIQALADIGYEVFAEEPPPLPDDVVVDDDQEDEAEEPDSVTGLLPSSEDGGSQPAGVVAADTGSGCAVQPNAGGRPVTWSMPLVALTLWRRRKATRGSRRAAL